MAIVITVEQSRLGALNPFIYQQAQAQNQGGPTAFRHKGITGNNGIFKVKTPYDPVIGNGTVDARQLSGLTGFPAAGIPTTSGNP